MKKPSISQILKNDSNLAIKDGVDSDIVLTPTHAATVALRNSKKPEFMSLGCTLADLNRIDDLVLYFRNNGVKISRAKLLLAGIGKIHKDAQSMEYLKRFLQQNPDARRRKK